MDPDDESDSHCDFVAIQGGLFHSVEEAREFVSGMLH